MKIRFTFWGREIWCFEVKKDDTVWVIDEEVESSSSAEIAGGSSHDFDIDSNPPYPEDRYAQYYIDRPIGFNPPPT